MAQAQTINNLGRPNVIIIVSDDQGYGDFSAHGNPVLKTPNLDKLRSESVRFTDFHVAPMCTPTRGQLMTGQDALRNGATSVTAGRSFIRRGIPLMSEIFASNRMGANCAALILPMCEGNKTKCLPTLTDGLVKRF